MVTECSFRRLKARYGCLQRQTDVDLSIYVIHSCFDLNNFCEANDEYINHPGIKVIQKYDKEFLLPGLERSIVSKNKAGTKAIRNNYNQYFG